MNGFLDELQATVTAVAERVGPAVVGLGRGWGRGSGVVVAEGRVLTNAHVLRGEEVAVTRADGEVALGRVAGADDALDVAVIAVDTGAAPVVAWDPAAVERLVAGQAVFALADPGGRGLRTSFGMVTATGRSFRGPRGRRIRGSIEHSAPLPRGSSGGPLVDVDGRLLGINSVRMEGGLLLALPADAALRGAGRRARARRGSGPPAARVGAGAAARRAPYARRGRIARARGAARPRRRDRQPGGARRTAAGRPAGVCRRPATTRLRRSLRCARGRGRRDHARSRARHRGARGQRLTSVCEALR